MTEPVEYRTENEEYGMQFMEKITPPMNAGKITVSAVQQVEITKPDGSVVTDQLTAEKDFLIASRAFTMDVSDVYSVSPGDNACGNFTNELPHITFCRKTLPWEYETAFGEPWVALIPLTEKEYEEKDITIAELKQNREKDIYFPVSALPDIHMEKDSDICHVIDLDRTLFQNIAPRKGERSLLTHGKFLNLLQKTDETVKMDGYFSTVVGCRFVPPSDIDAVKSVMHLVSMLGYDDPEKLPDHYPKVRLVSLYRWTVFSKGDEKPGFVSLMENMRCDVLRVDKENELLQHGYVPKRHLFRSGESTISLYRGPLVPFPVPQMETGGENPPATADGALIFDRDNALFDTSYSAAWQIGRLLTLQNKAVAAAIAKWRKNTEEVFLQKSALTFLAGKMNGAYSPETLAGEAVGNMLLQPGSRPEAQNEEQKAEDTRCTHEKMENGS